MTGPAIIAEGLGKRYHIGGRRLKRPLTLWERAQQRRAGGPKPVRGTEHWALRHISFEVDAGTVLGVVGANGAGKTTLLKLLARVSPPTEGRAIVRGRVVSLLEVGAGFQREYSGRENVFLNAALYGIPRGVAARRFDEIVEFAELERFIDTPVKRYSSGMYLRLAFSVAINMGPDVLLADEVLAVGDMAFQERCLQRVERAGADGLTVLFVSHDMAAVRRLCDRTLWLSGGRLVDDGETSGVLTRYEQTTFQGITARDIAERPELDILDVRLETATGDPIGAARMHEPCRVAIALGLNVPLADVRCSIRLDVDGVAACVSFQRERTRLEGPGRFTASVDIPADLLADRQYAVTANVLFEADGETARVKREHALTFRAYETDERRSRGDYSEPVAGVLRPLMHWDIVRADQPSSARAGEAP